MLELVFVIAIIGILAAIAVPKLAATRDDATIARARATVAAVRSSVAAERQKRVLKGDFANPITKLGGAANPFNRFNPDRDGDANRVLEYPVAACASATARSCWTRAGRRYLYRMYDNTVVTFRLTNAQRFDCITPASGCSALTR
jgi:general secretion pathway protein G